METDFQKVVKEAKKWGIKTIFYNELYDIKNFKECPFSFHIGIVVRTKTLYIKRSIIRNNSRAYALLHEMAHIIMGKQPENVQETDCMLAIEYYTAKRLNLKQWNKNMYDYIIDENNTCWGKATLKQKMAVINRAAREARRLKLLSKENVPTYKALRYKR